MKHLKKGMGLLLSSLFMVSALAGCGNANGGADGKAAGSTASGEKKIVLKMANITKADSQLSLTLKNIGEELKAKTNGRISPQYFPGGELGNETDMMQQLNTGSIQMAVITTAQLSNSSPAFGAWLMPYLVDTHDQAYKLWTSDESMQLFDTLKNENVVGLGYASSGFRYILGTKPVQSVKDLEGYKLRTTPSPTILDYWNGLKAGPTPMPLTDVYTSLQTGVIKGVDIDSESLASEKLTEIAKNLNADKHMYWAGGILINKDLWNSLSPDDQKLIKETVLAKTKQNSVDIQKNEDKLLSDAKTKMGLTLNEVKREEYDPIVKSVRETWSKKSPEIAKFLEKADKIKQEK
ncbi:TRAP transporter substrate-binding protein [Paenibacillus sp. UNC451MF]|uniref:TRAP transporter substrate-binding protein n=1 Tax=Paenibacillus sp. UNC451MF TaxID=1449063 RepID=UPI00049209B2|nr:TRAP transporter substrate-binding protein [Paenibacillus sp. UNC451MF]